MAMLKFKNEFWLRVIRISEQQQLNTLCRGRCHGEIHSSCCDCAAQRPRSADMHLAHSCIRGKAESIGLKLITSAYFTMS